MKRQAVLLSIVPCIALLAMPLIGGGSCPNRSSTDDTVTRIREVRDRIAPPSGEITLLPGEHVIDVDINCMTTDPECLVIVTRPMRRREAPRTLTVHLPYVQSPAPPSITIREIARPRR